MATSRTATLRSAAVAAALVSALAGAGCAATGPRPYQSPKADVLPESNPAAMGTVAMQAVPLPEVDQIVVKMGRDQAGHVVVLQVLSPALTPEQQREVMRAFSLGDWKRQVPLPPQTESWIETLVKNKP